MKKRVFLFALATVIAAAACNKGEEEGVVINPQDIGFVHSATLNNIAEIALSQLAFDSSQTPEIKAFAQKMVNEHSQLQGELEALASNMGIPTPDTLETKYTQLMAQLRNLKDRSFDSVYIHNQLDDHQTAIILYSNAHSLGNNSQIKDFARGVLPRLLEHREEAYSVAIGY
jgi:putative membrane protein